MLCVIDGESFDTFMKNTWIGDIIIDTGMFNIEDINKLVSSTVGMMTTAKKGSKKELMKQVDGTGVCVVLSHVKHYADMKVNLISATSLQSQGIEVAKDIKGNIELRIENKKNNF